MSRLSTRARVRLLAAPALVGALLLTTASSASAGALWRLDSTSAPTYLSLGREARVIATANNIGNGVLVGSGVHPVTVMDRLPAGLRVPSVLPAPLEGKLEANDRSEAASTLKCQVVEPERREVSCATTPTTQPLAPFTQLRVTIPVEVLSGAATGEQNTVGVSGGKRKAARNSRPQGRSRGRSRSRAKPARSVSNATSCLPKKKTARSTCARARTRFS